MDFKELFGEELGTQIEAVIADKNVSLIVDDKENPNFIPKSRFDEVIQQKNQFKTQVGELTGELESFKKSAKGNEELTAQIEEMQSKYQGLQEAHNKALIDSAIKMQGLKHKARNPDVLKKFIDYENLKLDEEGNVEGLIDQINALKESEGYLFEQEKAQPNGSPANPVNVVTQKSIEEQYEEARKNGNQTLAIHLKNKMFGIT